MPFRYRLIFLTSGRAEVALRTWESFWAKVTPRPYEVFIFDDGGRTGRDTLRHEFSDDPNPRFFIYDRSDEPSGFCEASRRCWKEAAKPDVDWVYWLEDDFVHDAPVDLTELALVLKAHPVLAQMALCRQAVNEKEIAAGGLVASRPGEFQQRRYQPEFAGGPRHDFLEHESYWTTNVSLFRLEIAVKFPWPDGPHCEGKLGINMRERGYKFGLWGDGSVWTTHIGDRQGFGY